MATAEEVKKLAALARIPPRMLREGSSPSDLAAEIVLQYAEHGRAPPD